MADTEQENETEPLALPADDETKVEIKAKATSTSTGANTSARETEMADGDETASASTGGAFEASSFGDDDDDDDESPLMPIMKYSRVSGLPRSAVDASSGTDNDDGAAATTTTASGPLSTPLSCSSLAQVLLNPWNETGDNQNATIINPGGTRTSTNTNMNMNLGMNHNGSHSSNSTANGAGNNINNRSHHEDPQQMLRSDLWSQQPFYVVAAGFDTGKVSILSLANGRPVVSQTQLAVREASALASSNNPPPVVDVSFDSSGTVLAAMDEGGTCAVWELKYFPTWTRPSRVSLTTRPSASSSEPTAATTATASEATTATTTATTTTTAANTNTSDNMFTSFMSALTGMPPPEASTSRNNTTTTNNSTSNITTAASTTATSTAPNSSTSENTTEQPPPVLCLAASILQVARVTYPTHWKPPTCIALDPAYKRKREKSFCVGFADGRLLLTKRGGGLFQRRNDAVLFQGNSNTNNNDSEIQCITWRASLVAWADASGIKLMDVDTLTRIAHIDRPTGARPTLYPTVSALQPHLCFETSKRLLVAWGDCLMTMQINEAPASPQGSGGEEKPRRSVECTMAWELEGVACGVVPIDEDHVGILALVTPEDDEDDDDDEDEGENDGNGPALNTTANVEENTNDLEVQILSRKDGTILYCDSLPLIRPSPSSSTTTGSSLHVIESAKQYSMLSTFALPRMDDVSELEEFNTWTLNNPAAAASSAIDEFDMNALFSAGSRDAGDKPTFVDGHLKWNIKSILFDDDDYDDDDDDDTDSEAKEEERAGDKFGDDGDYDHEEDDTNSVDSDDYRFALRPIVDESILQSGPSPSPPLMMIASGSDIVLGRMADIDDAVAHALSQSKAAMALSRGLRHRRQLRRYPLSDLVNNYLHAVLKVSPPPRPLSLRRMNMAVQAMPVLLGGQTDMWDKWSKELEKIPGSLFLLRNHLPVRDPILSPTLYGGVLQTMFIEVNQMMAQATTTTTKTTTLTTPRLDLEAAQHFLESLLAWGPTKVLKEHIKLYKYSRETCNSNINHLLKPVEVALQRRYLQTAAGYLNFPVNPEGGEVIEAAEPRYEANKDDSQDSLFQVDEVLEWLLPQAPLAALPYELNDTTAPTNPELNNQICLDTIARLRMMQNRYDLALKTFLAIGTLHSPLSMQQLELEAINLVNSVADSNIEPVLFGSSSYAFVLGIIDFHHLHQLLLDDSFLPKRQDGSSQTPIFALLRMVGLPLMGNFLIEHCVSPEFSSSADHQFSREEPIRKETLPLDDVAEQLAGSPALLHWYLNLVFTKKPELYVKFPNNAIPPKAVTELHREHFKLHVRFAGDAKDSAKSLAGTDVYNVEARTTPLLSFLRATLPLGGVLPVDARRELEIQRSEGSDPLSDDSDDENEETHQSNSFSLELAYIIEHYSEETEAEAMGVLDLYLEGANSLMLAVSYAQRHRQFSSVLWDKLITYCLSKSENGPYAEGGKTLFGSLLEAAALSGADLARLVAKIPPGMVVEGLRPRLVAAVADYRFKLDIHQAAASAASEERVALLREVAHRSRRGVRYSLPNQPKVAHSNAFEESKNQPEDEAQAFVLSKTLRTVERRGHHRLAYSIPMR